MAADLLARINFGEYAVSLAAGLFLVFYGLGLAGWVYDVSRGLRVLERMSPRLRRAIGVVLIAAGAFMIVSPLL